MPLTDLEQRVAKAVARRRDDIVALTGDLVSFDTTSRTTLDMPARDDAACQELIARRLRLIGAEVEVWEPEPFVGGSHPLVPDEGVGFAGRPQLKARIAGSGGGQSLLLNGHIDVVAAEGSAWTTDPFEPVVRDGRLYARGSCDMKGGIAAMLVAAEVLRAEGVALDGDLLVCTNTDEECGGWGALACARSGVRADWGIIPEPSRLEVWPACRGSIYATIRIPGRAGHVEIGHDHWRNGGAVNAAEKASYLIEAIRRLREDWRSRREFAHPLLSPPDVVVCSLHAAADWVVTIPDEATMVISVLYLPVQADTDGWGRTVSAEVEAFLRAACAADPWLAAHPPVFEWHTVVNPAETLVDSPLVATLVGACADLAIPTRLGGLDSWYDGGVFDEHGTKCLMFGPNAIDHAHTANEYVPIDDLVACAQGIAVAAMRLCGVSDTGRQR